MKTTEKKKYHENGISRNDDRGHFKPFELAYTRLKQAERDVVKDIVMRRCGIKSRQHFYMLKNGRTGIRPVHQDIISATFKAFGVDAWTGERLN